MTTRSPHPDPDRLRTYHDPEVPESARREVAAHLAACSECRSDLTRMEDLRRTAVEATTLPLPSRAWERILARREAGETVLLPMDAVAHEAPAVRRPVAPAWSRVAALALLGIAGVASATLPGSPVREWLNRAGDVPASKAPSGLESTDAGAASAAGEARAATTISIAPADDALRISVERPDPRARIRVRLSDRSDARVEAQGAAAAALLRTGRGRIDIVGPGAGELHIDLPVEVPSAVLVVDGVPYLRKQNGEIRILASDVDTVGSEFWFGSIR